MVLTVSPNKRKPGEDGVLVAGQVGVSHVHVCLEGQTNHQANQSQSHTVKVGMGS